ncbi:MAG: VCBS repeat-containing protein, partial [Deltaproteobacteria bacterium]|nr:VCBS repeat-containing protein [Deltaproteobacteria bacterium]
SQHRECDGSGEVAVCGACLPGYHEDGGACVEDGVEIELSVQTPADAHGMVELSFSIADPLSRPADAVVYFRVGGGELEPASPPLSGTSPLTGLSTSPQGTQHAFTWATVADLGKGSWQSVRVSVEVTSPISASAESGPFAVVNGTFLRARSLLEDGQARDAVFSDVDADGDLDLAVACVGQSRLLLNDGGGQYGAAPDGCFPSLEGEVFSVAAGDLDGDADPDLVFAVGRQASAPARNRVFINRGDGCFDDATETVFPDVADQSEKVVLVDIDGDGDLDIWVVNSGSQQDRLHRNDGGVFADITGSALPAETLMGADGAAVDLDGEGDQDLVFVNFITSQGVHLLRNADGSFADVTDSWLPGGQPSQMLMGVSSLDADGDDDLDLYLVDSLAQDVLLINDGSGVLQPGGSLPSDVGIGGWKAAALDVDLDGDQDVFVVTTSAADILLLNDSQALFGKADAAIFSGGATAARNVAVGDADGDGDPDLFVAVEGDPSILWINAEQ